MSTAEINPARKQLTVIVLYADERGDLNRALTSVQAIADEMLIVDCLGQRQVAEMAQRYGARCIDHPWQDSFSLARNAGMAAAQGDCVLWLEADEFLPADQARSLRDLVDQQAGPLKAWLVYVQRQGAAPQDAPERIAQLRLLPNCADVRFAGRVGETVRHALAAQQIAVELSSLTVMQGASHDEPVARHARARRNLKLLDKELPQRGPQPSLLCLLGQCYQDLGNPAAAGKYYQQAVRSARPGTPELLEAYYGLLTTIDDAHHETRLTSCLQALEAFPFDAQLLCAMGSYLHSQNRPEMACRAYQTAVQIGQVHPETWHLVNISEVAAHCLATMWQLLEQDDKARQVLQEALNRHPTSARLRQNLIDLEVRFGRVIDALGHLEKLPAEFPQREAFRSAVRGACQAARNNWIPAMAYLQTAYDAGCRDTICLRWLWMALVRAERASEADAILEQWGELEPGNLEVRKYLAEAADRAAAQAVSPQEGRQVRIDLPGQTLDAHGAAAIRSGKSAAASESY
jgi:tetratricopeptide (TPR) repeat protein